MADNGNISENSRRIARNTVFLYFRMLLMLFIGLFTSRIILKQLGVVDYGVYNVVGGVVTLFTFVTNSVVNAISRFLAVEIARGDKDKLRRVFSTSVIIQIIIAAFAVLFVETVGLWLLNHKLNIPPDRLGSAFWVLQCAMCTLVINLIAVPYNATIVAHERMDAYAIISILEGVLKFTVALLLYISAFDKLITYAVLMVGVALLVRLAFGTFCKKNFEESRGKVVWDGSLIKEMSGFAGWSFFGSSAYIFNTQGVNIVSNLFFGVTINSARGVALQVEGIVKQFVTNILTAFNPQITKSYAAEDPQYSFELVLKACKYTFLVILVFLLPVFYLSDQFLDIWLANVPEHAPDFVRLTILCLLGDMICNPLQTLQLATGKIRKYYLVTGAISYMVLPIVWIAFKMGASAGWAYVIYFCVYLVVNVARLLIVHAETGFPISEFLKEIAKLLLVTICSFVPSVIVFSMMPDGLLRLFVTCIVTWLFIAGTTWLFALTEGEKVFVKEIIGKYLHK